MKFRQLNEALDWVVKGTDENDIVARIQHVLATDSSFRGYMMIAFQKECRITCLPEGLPPVVKLQRDIPDGMGETTLRAEFRRVKAFATGQAMERVKSFTRENVWLQILEGIHWKEAELLTHIKDQTLHGLYPALASALPKATVPVTIDVDAPAPVSESATAPAVSIKGCSSCGEDHENLGIGTAPNGEEFTFCPNTHDQVFVKGVPTTSVTLSVPGEEPVTIEVEQAEVNAKMGKIKGKKEKKAKTTT